MPASQCITAKPVATASSCVLTYAMYYPYVYPIQHTLPVSFIIPIREKIRDRKYKHAFQRTPYILHQILYGVCRDIPEGFYLLRSYKIVRVLKFHYPTGRDTYREVSEDP